MPQEIIDLDESGVIATPVHVRLHGTVYQLPGDIPAALFVRITNVAANPDATDADGAQALYDEMLAAFQVYQPDLDRLPLGINEMVAVVGRVYRGTVDAGPVDEDEAAAVAPPPKTRTTRAKKPATPKRSRSST